jgi:hypothetical protein
VTREACSILLTDERERRGSKSNIVQWSSGVGISANDYINLAALYGIPDGLPEVAHFIKPCAPDFDACFFKKKKKKEKMSV